VILVSASAPLRAPPYGGGFASLRRTASTYRWPAALLVGGAFLVIAHFVDYPELREYFYEGVELPEDSTTRARVLAVAELMADALQSNYWLFQGKDVESLGSVDDPALDIRSDWDDWTEFILTMSPALRSFVRAHTLQYPFLVRMLDTIESATTG